MSQQENSQEPSQLTKQANLQRLCSSAYGALQIRLSYVMLHL